MVEPCVVCGELFSERGHNAEPLKKGRCCDGCNGKVIKHRMDLILRGYK